MQGSDMSGSGTSLIRSLTKKREKERAEFEAQKQQIEVSANSGTSDINSKFARQTLPTKREQEARSYGLVTHEEFKAKQAGLLKEQEKAAEVQTKKQKKKKKRKKVNVSTLSFGNDEEGLDAEVEEPALKKPRIHKNPEVETGFLPDTQRDMREAEERLELEREWKGMQKKAKAEILEITYSYWDGSGHRRKTQITKGTTIRQFLDIVRQEFSHELRGVSCDDLMYIKEDLIIASSYSFYDLIVSKARGKSGPLFSFDVHDDIRLVSDATVEKDESHAGKVCQRRWYERNKHIFPASRWEPYDPNKTWDKYTIRGGEVN